MSRRLLPILPPALCFVAAVAAVTLAPGLAHAADAGDTAKEGKPKPAWLKEKHILEVGGYLGAFFTAADHGLYGDGVASTARPLKTGFDVGLRIAYMPLRFVGIEAEGGVVPTKLDGQGGYKTTLFAARAHVILQTPTRLALFVVVGGGLKYYVTPKVVLRIDGRDVLSPNFSKGTPGGLDFAHNAEFTFGASFVLGRQTTKMLPKG